MHTLFAENILTPSPAQTKQSTSFELLFPSSNPSSFGSSHSSPAQSDWLTRQLQSSPRTSGGETSYTHGSPRAHPLRNKGDPKLLFMGLRRCGKSSIQKVVFQKLPPADTLYLEPTNKIETASLRSFLNFESAEIPSSLPVLSADFDHQAVFANVGAVIWVIDSQDEYLVSITELLRTAVFLAEHHPRINFEVFIHKIDGLSEEYKYETFREVRQRVQDELSDVGYGDRSVSYYQTSVFDHSILEAMSKVVQKLLPQLPALEALLNKLCSTCRIQKAYLFDTVSKIYVATDATPSFLKDYEVCSDYVDVIVDIKQLYGWHGKSSATTAGASRPTSSDDDDGSGTTTGDEEDSVGESVVTYDSSGDTYIYAREVNDYLSLICVMGKGSSADQRMLIDYNVAVLYDALQQVFRL